MSQGNTAPSKIPNLYELLQLQPKEADDQLIRAALRRFAERVKKIESPQAAQQAAKLFAIAKQNLLDPTRKAAYDSLWDKVFSSTQPVVTNSKSSAATKADSNQSTLVENRPIKQSVPDWDLDELNAILPSGDPFAPLDLAEFLETTDINVAGQRTVEDLDRDFEKLLTLLGGAKGELATESNPASVAWTAICNSAQPMDLLDFSTNGSQVPFATIVPQPAVQVPDPHARPIGRTAPARTRRRRDLSLIFMVGGGIVTLLAVLGFMLMKLMKNNEAKQLANNNTVPTQNSTISKQTENERKIVGSGLPPAGSGLPKPGEQNQTDDGNGLLQSNGIEPMEPTTNPTSQPPMEEKPATQPDPVTPLAPPASSATPETPSNPATESSNTPSPPVNKPIEPTVMADKPSASPTTEATNETVELTAVERATWKRQMTQARNALGNREFDKAEEILKKIEPTAKSAAQKSQYARLQTIAPLAKQFHEALKQALSDAKSGETVEVNKQVINFVEFRDEKTIILKITTSKAPVRYEWKDLPVGIAFAFADLKLDQSPASAAAKGAFAAVHTKTNQNTKEAARKLMQSAAAAEVVPADTHEVFDDDYSLE